MEIDIFNFLFSLTITMIFFPICTIIWIIIGRFGMLLMREMNCENIFNNYIPMADKKHAENFGFFTLFMAIGMGILTLILRCLNFIEHIIVYFKNKHIKHKIKGWDK